jgi:hypothetical protein
MNAAAAGGSKGTLYSSVNRATVISQKKHLGDIKSRQQGGQRLQAVQKAG